MLTAIIKKYCFIIYFIFLSFYLFIFLSYKKATCRVECLNLHQIGKGIWTWEDYRYWLIYSILCLSLTAMGYALESQYREKWDNFKGLSIKNQALKQQNWGDMLRNPENPTPIFCQNHPFLRLFGRISAEIVRFSALFLTGFWQFFPFFWGICSGLCTFKIIHFQINFFHFLIGYFYSFLIDVCVR